MQVYESRGWRLAEDHINFTIGRLAINLNQGSESVEALTRLLRPGSQQNASQQSAFLKEFLISHNVSYQKKSFFYKISLYE